MKPSAGALQFHVFKASDEPAPGPRGRRVLLSESRNTIIRDQVKG
jgi:hypothetical protein